MENAMLFVVVAVFVLVVLFALALLIATGVSSTQQFVESLRPYLP